MSNMWVWSNADAPQNFPETPWALDLKMDDFPYPKLGKGNMKDQGKGEWFWESGFNKDPIKDLEIIRDWNLRAVFGAFNAMKNRDGKAEHEKAKLDWVAYVGGTRESRYSVAMKILVKSAWGSDDPTKSAFAFLHANALVEAGHEAQIFLLGEAVSVMRDPVAAAIVPVGWPPLAEVLRATVGLGIPLHV